MKMPASVFRVGTVVTCITIFYVGTVDDTIKFIPAESGYNGLPPYIARV